MQEPPQVKEIILTLKKNRKILEELMGTEEMCKQPKIKFSTKGFLFDYHTHLYKNKNGNTYYFCFEYGYLPLEGDWFLLVKRKKWKNWNMKNQEQKTIFFPQLLR